MEFLRTQPFARVPGTAESLDWALALVRLHRDALDEQTLEQTMGCILKVHDDWELLRTLRPQYEPLLAHSPQGGVKEPIEPDYGLGTVNANVG